MRAVFDLRCLTEQSGTGVAAYTRRMLPAIAKELYETGDEWVSFTSGAKKTNPSLPAIFKKKHVSSPNSLLNFLVVAKAANASRWYGAPDIFWQPNPMFTPEVKAKQIVCVHDLSFLHWPSFFPRHTRFWYLRWVREWLKKEHLNVILTAISEFTHNDVLENFPHWRGRIFVQYQPPPTLRQRSDIKPGSSRTILFVGTLEPRKNVLSLIDGFKQFNQKHREYKLRLVGQATKWWQAQKIKLPENIIVSGYLSEPELAKTYQESWCLVYPSFFEGYGLPPLEAMAYGRPVIASNNSGTLEAVGDAALLIDPYRGAEEIAAALSELAEDQTYYKNVADRGYERVSRLNKNFDLQVLRRLWKNSA